MLVAYSTGVDFASLIETNCRDGSISVTATVEGESGVRCLAHLNHPDLDVLGQS